MEDAIIGHPTNSPSVLLTGCNGYAASHIRRALRNIIHFIGVDIAAGDNAAEILDLRNSDSLTSLDRHKFSYVLHAAWDQTSDNIYTNNIASSQNLLTYLKSRETKGIIFLSSSYASTTVDIQYARSKLDVENMVFDSGLPFVIIRPDMLYSSDESKIQEQLSYMKYGFSICIGNGRSLRTPTHISDLIELIAKVITTNTFTNKVYELGSPIPYSQNDILRTISASAGLRSMIVRIPTSIAKLLFRVTRKVDPEQADTIRYDRIADLTSLREDFGLVPVTFEAGMRR